MGCDIHAVIEHRGGPDSPWEPVMGDLPSAFDDRNYAVFAVLADVRNYDGLPPITETREFPADFMVRPEYPWGLRDEHDPDIHSRSWLTLTDFDGYDWDQTITPWLLVGERTYLKWRAEGKGEPDGGCRYASGTTTLTPEQYDAAEADGSLPSGQRMVHITWTTTVRDEVGPKLFDAIEEMRKLGEGDNVRVVFGFDN